MHLESQDHMQQENGHDLADSDTDAWGAVRPGGRRRWLWAIVAAVALLLIAATLSNWALARRTAAELAAAKEALEALAERTDAADEHLGELRQQFASIENRVEELARASRRSQEQIEREVSRLGDELATLARRTAIVDPNWELVFEDTFERDELGPNWDYNPDQCSCTVAGGWLDVSTQRSALCAITKDFRGNMRLEYDARGVEGEYLSDMSAYVCAQVAHPLRVGPGYFVGLGSDWNQLAKITRDTIKVAQRPLRLDADRTYHMTIERVGPDVIAYVDGAPVVHFTDPAPIRGNEQSRIVLYSYRSHIRFDNVRVYQLKHGRGGGAADD